MTFRKPSWLLSLLLVLLVIACWRIALATPPATAPNDPRITPEIKSTTDTITLEDRARLGGGKPTPATEDRPSTPGVVGRYKLEFNAQGLYIYDTTTGDSWWRDAESDVWRSLGNPRVPAVK
jgi:hypothetical protein